ncbi:TPA: hypothetical protein ACGORW_001264 [Streptococcus suis]|nr:hypothetical protein [Streptococcus suis]HEM5989870.1 hypothetical protein [Streptococcus suis]HEM5997717.1 hypothetical protein [Streptococcus suis]HEM6089496.1 hypothetical protein [Streptococcus suis]HEM6266305.1 hypothetical protein [Streptococcus suis]
MNLEKEKTYERNVKIFFVLCFLWIPYIGFFIYWIIVDVDYSLLTQMILTALVLPAFFQPFFWYMMLGCILASLTWMYADKLNAADEWDA